MLPGGPAPFATPVPAKGGGSDPLPEPRGELEPHRWRTFNECVRSPDGAGAKLRQHSAAIRPAPILALANHIGERHSVGRTLDGPVTGLLFDSR